MKTSNQRLAELKGFPRRFDRNQYVYHQGDEIQAIYQVLSGSVASGRLTVTGHELMLAQFGDGDWFGADEILLGIERRECFAQVIQRATVLPVLIRDLSPTSLYELRQLALDRLYRSQLCLADLVPETPQGRVISILRHLASQGDTIRMSHRKLGRAAGCPQETVNRTLQLLSQSGVVRLERCSITVLDFERLGVQ